MLPDGAARAFIQDAQAAEQGEEQEAHFMSLRLRHTEPRTYAVFRRFWPIFTRF